MAFPDSFVEDVRRAADLYRVVSEHVTLKKVGASSKGLCPFHQEKTPSFNVRGDHFHCFGCGEGGDVFKFLMLRERVSFPEAVETLAQRFGLPLPEKSFEAGPDRKERDEILALMEAASDHYRKTLWSAGGTRARDYLLGRGFEKETLEAISAGAARDSWTDLLDALKKRFSPQLLTAAGLVLEKTGGHYDRFRNRAIFPIRNDGGKVVAFGARSLDGSEPKYLNSPETAIYQKGRTLYGLSWAKEAFRKEGRCVLVEGYLDVARALASGISEAVATCGTALTPGHARLLRRFVETVFVNFDQDEAGQKAARKSLDTLLEEGLVVRVVELPQGHDPDSFLKAFGAEAYRERLAEAPEGMEWLVRRALAEHHPSTPRGKANYLEALLPTLAHIGSPVERKAWFDLIVERGELDPRAAEDQLRKTGSARKTPAPEPQRAPPARAKLLPAERFFVALLLSGAEGAEAALAELEEEDIQGLASAEILRKAKTLSRRGVRVTTAAVGDDLGEDVRRILTEMAVEGPPSEGLTALSCVRELKSLPLKARMAEIQRNLTTARGEGLEALLQEKLQLRRLMANL
ncbi:MAG TPA: DNA primase [Vicinamibacteria bacterium]|jgi:DNA primase|nr:DNA primase [Vicinamibacteria bacterium]